MTLDVVEPLNAVLSVSNRHGVIAITVERKLMWPDFSEMTDEQLNMIVNLSEGRILKIDKDALRMGEEQLLWSPQLEKDVVGYWSTLNGYWENKTFPKCTCADYEGGFMARESYNPYFYDGEPCSLKYLKKWKESQSENK